MSNIIIRGLKKSFAGKTALYVDEMRIAEGEVTCLMGPSGCGKTTLINILTGLIKADEGTVTGLPGRVSCVFQEDRLLESISLQGNIRAFLPRGANAEEIKAHLSRLGLEDSLRKKAQELSGGMRRRAAIARAVLYRPRLLILDEPFKGLDAATRLMTMDYVKDETDGVTVLCVTHEPAEAAYMGGTLIRMSKPDA